MGETEKPPENGGSGGSSIQPHGAGGNHPQGSSGSQPHHHHHHHHHHHPPSQSSSLTHHHQLLNGLPSALQALKKPFTAYKLIVDPALVKGALKVYRVDGVIPDDTTYPNILVRDPRKQKNALKATEPMVLPIPPFKIDANYVGEIPPTDVTFTNLNDNVSENFLHQLTLKYGMIDNVRIYYHPISHRHLGFGHVLFRNSRDAKTCVEKLNGQLVMGQKVYAFHDPSGKRCDELFVEVTTQKPGSSSKDERKGASSSSSVSKHAHKSTLSKQGAVQEVPHHPFKEDTPHDSGIVSTSSEDRKSTVSSSHSSKSSRGSGRERDREPEGFKRFNVSYERYEPSVAAQSANSNYGYPIQSSRNTLPSSSLSSHGSQNSMSMPPSPLVSSHGGGSQPSIVNNNNTEKCNDDEGELSPKIDLDTRIKMMLEGRNSSDFGRLFSDGNITPSGSESESDTEPSPLKRARLSLGSASATIWDSESDEESNNKEASFAKKFKQSFVPVKDSQDSSALKKKSHGSSSGRGNANYSPPPSPFLTFSQGSNKTVKGKADPEFDQISDDEGQVSGARDDDKDDMSLSSLSPEPADSNPRIKQGQFFSNSITELHRKQPPQYGEYFDSSYPQGYHQMGNWQSHPPHGPPSSHHAYLPPGYNGYDPHSALPPPPIEEKPVIKQEDHKNPEMLIDALIEQVQADLNQVLRRDCIRRLIEVEAFKLYEDWWTSQEQEYKRKQEEEQAKNQPSAKAADEPFTTADAVVVSASAEAVLGGLSGLGFRNIPKLPSFRKKIEAAEQAEEDSRRSYIDSDSDLSSSSDDEIVSKKPKHKFDFSSSEEDEDSDDDDASSVSSKSTISGDEVRDVTDAEAISTTEDENEFSDAKARQLEDDEDYKLPPTPGARIETEDILSDDDSPEESGALPDDEQSGSLGICNVTGRMIVKQPKPALSDAIENDQSQLQGPRTPSRKPYPDGELEEGMILSADEATPVKTISTKVTINEESKSPLYNKIDLSIDIKKEPTDYFAPTNNEEDRPLLIPDDLVRPRGLKKSSKLCFRPREEHEILDICYEFLRDGIDAEDILYFRKAYELLLVHDSFFWLNSTHWVNHPTTVIKKKPTTPVKKKKKQKGEPEEGSIRTRGFVRMTKEEKTRAMAGQQPLMSFDTSGVALNIKNDAGALKARETQIREARQNQRRLLTALGTESDLLKFNQLQFRKKIIQVGILNRDGVIRRRADTSEKLGP